MAVGSGIGSSFGFVNESTYGTYLAPTRWVEGSAKLRKTKNPYQGGAMAAGRLVQPGSKRYITHRGGGGTFDCAVVSSRMGHLLNGLMGGTVVPVQQGGTPAYLQTHALADPVGQFYTMQAGVPDLGGTVRPYTWLGSQILSAEFSCDIGGALMATFEVVAKDVTEGQTLAAPSYPTNNEFHHGIAAVKLGTFGGEALVDGVRKLSVKIGRPRHDGGPYMGNLGLRSKGVLNDWAEVSGTFEVDYLDKTVFADRFAATSPETPTSLVWEFVGPVISGAFFETFRIRCPQIYFDGDTPTADSPDVVRTSYPFKGQFDLTNAAATIEYISVDVTL
jgi:hypothetical protein